MMNRGQDITLIVHITTIEVLEIKLVPAYERPAITQPPNVCNCSLFLLHAYFGILLTPGPLFISSGIIVYLPFTWPQCLSTRYLNLKVCVWCLKIEIVEGIFTGLYLLRYF